MEIPYDFDETQLKNAYLKACKHTHPDVNPSQPDGQRFSDVEDAYRKLKQHLNTRLPQRQTETVMNGQEEEEESGRRPKVAQHRHYLSLEGVGYGTPSERIKQYDKHRLTRATNRVNDFNLNKIRSTENLSHEKSLAIKDVNLQREIKTKQGFERLVEDLIQESMAKGDFNNLAGYGKPLKARPDYPYVDSTTFKLNEILINNGFVPEWVLLEKEIRDVKNQIKDQLNLLRSQSKLSNDSLVRRLLADKVKEVNKLIDKYNRIVPIVSKQQIHVILDKEVKKMLAFNDNRVGIESGTQEASAAHNQSQTHSTCERSKEEKTERSDTLFKKVLSLLSQ